MPASTRGLQGKKSLLEIALDLHTSTTGAMERDPAFDILDFLLLDKALNDWQEPSSKFDELVKKLLIQTTIDYQAKSLKDR